FAPHFLEIVMGPDLWLEHMYDHVARVDQHPISLRLTLYREPSTAGECFFEPLGQRQNLPRRAATGDYHLVRDRRLSGQTNRDDVLGSTIIEGLQDKIENCRVRLVEIRGVGAG